MHHLTSLAKCEIEALESEGIRLTAHEVVHICALAAMVETPSARMELARGRPIALGDIYLWPVTLAAADWWERVGDSFTSSTMKRLSLAYAMAHGRDTLPESPKEAKREIKAWARTLKCTAQEMVEAISQVQEQSSTVDTGDAGPESERATAGDVSMMLTAMTGTSPEVWEYQCSISYALETLRTLAAQNAAEGESMRYDKRLIADKALGLCVHRIRKRHERDLENA
jgi:hypothetical protein